MNIRNKTLINSNNKEKKILNYISCIKHKLSTEFVTFRFAIPTKLMNYFKKTIKSQ